MTEQPNNQTGDSRRRRVLFIAEAVTLAHVARPAVLAQSLPPDRYEVHFATDPRYNKLFPNLPFPIRPIESIPSDRFLHRLAKGIPIYTTTELRRYVEDDLKLLKEIKPDLVIGDFRLSLAVSAPLTKTPYATLTNAYWSPYAQVRFTIPDNPLVNFFGVRIAQFLFDLSRLTIFALHTIPMNRVRRKYGLPNLGWDLRRVYTHADHVLYTDLPEMVPMRPLPSNHHFIGPVLWSPTASRPIWWDELPTDKPIIYLTLGSSGKKDLLPTILEALSEMEIYVMVATAGRIELHQVPSNAFIADYLPGEEASRLASIVICNGGSPTTAQALAAGKPVLGIPTNLDQYLNMQGILNMKQGELLRTHALKAQDVKLSIQRLLVNTSESRGNQLQKKVSGFDTASRFATVISSIPIQGRI